MNRKPIAIQARRSGRILYEGLFPSYRACLEKAVRDGTELTAADFSYKNLANASLDGAHMRGADFRHANLTGANMSEACLEEACFLNASLYNTCLAFSNLRGCDLEGAAFGATDLTGSDISHACFSTLSCFGLDFEHVGAMEGCSFKNPNGTLSMMTRPPLVIRGRGAHLIVLLDDYIKIGSLTLPYRPEGILQDRSINHLKRNKKMTG